MDVPGRQNRFVVPDQVEAVGELDGGVAGVGLAAELAGRVRVQVFRAEPGRVDVHLADDAQGVRDRPRLQRGGAAAVPDEVVQAEDGEVAVALVEGDRRFDVGGLAPRCHPSRPAPGSRTNKPSSRRSAMSIQPDRTQELGGVDAVGNRDHRVVGADRRLGRDVHLRRPGRAVDVEGLRPVPGHLPRQLVGAGVVVRRERTAVQRSGLAEPRRRPPGAVSVGGRHGHGLVRQSRCHGDAAAVPWSNRRRSIVFMMVAFRVGTARGGVRRVGEARTNGTTGSVWRTQRTARQTLSIDSHNGNTS